MAKKPVTNEEDLEEVDTEEASWFDGDEAERTDASFTDYEIVASPNDFNINTILDFIDSGVVVIPAFQRNYVWDIKRASKLIESLLIGLPIPQIFLYEQSRNSFLVIDGQQRLMSLYYFFKMRFPRKSQRPEIRRIFAEQGRLPPEILADDNYFSRFNLMLPGAGHGQESRFHKRNVDTLGEYKTTLGLRTIRNIIIKQTAPDDDGDSAVFEIFHRLNTGGVNLRNQEIRSSLYHSKFLSMLEKANLNQEWRRLLGLSEPDIHLKDIEILLRALAMLVDGAAYKEPMNKFLNGFAKRGKQFKQGGIDYFEVLIEAFFKKTVGLPDDIFSAKGGRRFNIAAFEAIFRAACASALASSTVDVPDLTADRLEQIKKNREFITSTQFGTAQASNVGVRFRIAREILGV